ncbi:MAG: hypothetical protein MJZ24_03685, partial [Paludibacteraceae bacterium]|nr:hypothetical protein [Paludibacteraceae bacterium]
ENGYPTNLIDNQWQGIKNFLDYCCPVKVFSIEVNVYRTAIINNNQLTLSTQRDICRELGLVIENKTKSTVVNYDREIRADVNAEGPEAHQMESSSRDILIFLKKCHRPIKKGISKCCILIHPLLMKNYLLFD